MLFLALHKLQAHNVKEQTAVDANVLFPRGN